MKVIFGFLFLSFVAFSCPASEPPTKQEIADFRGRVLGAVTKHLDALLAADGSVVPLKGKSADGMTALAFQIVHEITGKAGYRTAAVELADRIVAEMRTTKHGILFIKEKDKGEGEMIEGGGPPAFGWYASAAGYILRGETDRQEDLRYLATVTDQFPWNEKGWWANTVDIETGEPKEPIDKAGAVNKNAGMALAAAMLAECVSGIDPALLAKLKTKVERCLHAQILPAQEEDGFWHYGLKGNDPKGKDILGYFMVTADALAKLRHFAPGQCGPGFDPAMEKAFAFARDEIAPMTDPNDGPASKRTTASTPAHFELSKDTKRGFTLGFLLVAGGHLREGMAIVDHWSRNFPTGDAGQDGAKAVDSLAHILLFLPR